MTLKTRTKFTSQLQSIQEHVVRLKEKCAADVRAAGLAATGDRGAQEGSFRIVSDLSHIDGMTRDVAFLVEEIPDKAAVKFTREFVEMSEQAASMVERAVDAFVERDVKLAQQVIEADHKVNSLYAEPEEKLVALIRDGKSSAEYLPELLMVAKYFERIGDLAKRVAAWAIFRVTGEHRVEEKPSQAAGLDQ